MIRSQGVWVRSSINSIIAAAVQKQDEFDNFDRLSASRGLRKRDATGKVWKRAETIIFEWPSYLLVHQMVSAAASEVRNII